MTQKKGSILGGALLVAGSSIGAGMLGLPIVLGLLGFYPSLVLLIISWAFMTFTGLLLIEMNGWFSKRVNLISMATRLMGRFGKWIWWVLYLFLFYALLTAYVAASKSIGYVLLPDLFSHAWSVLLFPVVLGIVVFFGTRIVDFSNRLFMFGKIGFYCVMLVLGLPWVQTSLFSIQHPQFLLLPLPILVISFGFHNMIPSLVEYMHRDLQKVRKAILIGSVLCLVVLFFWAFMIIGLIPYEGKEGLLAAYKEGKEVSVLLQASLGTSYITGLAQGFAVCALFTAFLTQSLSLSHFLFDGFQITETKKTTFWILCLTILPPILCAVLNPAIFFKALNFAGGFCAVILFGILPIFMIWKGRYHQKNHSSYVVGGGKIALVVAFLFSCIVLLNELGVIT